MVEMLVACSLVMVPLFLAIPMIAKYLDMRSHTVQAARYAAWERSIYFGGPAAAVMGLSGSTTFSNKWDARAKSDDEIRKEIAVRILSNTDQNAKFTNTDKSAGAFAGDNNGMKPFWEDRNRTALLPDATSISSNDLQTGITNDTSPGLINVILGPVANVAAVVSNFTVDTSAKYGSTVSLGVKEVAFNVNDASGNPIGMAGCAGCPVDYTVTSDTPLNFSEKNVLVANGWSANGPGSLTAYGTNPERITVYNQIRGLSPTSILNPPPGIFRDILDVLSDIALVFFPELTTLELGKIDVDKVPKDRLGP
jgi:hypothetical protein